MKKKSKQNRKNTLKSKWLMGLLTTTFIVGVTAFSGTYAWLNSSDNRVNTFKGTKLTAEIDEVFVPNRNWQPGSTTTKEIRIKNSGQATSFVRVSLYEFLATLQVDNTDQTGNGNLKTVSAPTQPILDEENTDTWVKAAENHGTYANTGHYYVADTAIVSDPINKTGMYEYNSLERAKTTLNYITLNFADTFKETPPNELEKNWTYENGYFYYLKPLESGEWSEPLLKSVTLSNGLPNKYKGMFYKLKVYMDAHDLTQPLVDEWKLDKSGKVYSLLAEQLK